MFKKTKIAAMTSVVLGMAGAAVAPTAEAVYVNPNGTGQVLLYPYYNVNNGFVTNVFITNTTDTYKAVKIRFRESRDSQDVLDFNIYMSPRDVWWGVVEKNGDFTRVRTDDETCTYPGLDTEVRGTEGTLRTGVNMITSYPGLVPSDASEGYIEVIEMGVIPTDLRASATADTTTNSGDPRVAFNIEHLDGVPRDCSVIATAWNNGVGRGVGANVVSWRVDGAMAHAPDNTTSIQYPGTELAPGNANVPLLAPTGGLAGQVYLLNLETGSANVVDAVTIDDYATQAQHYRSDDARDFLLPSLASGNVFQTVDVAAGTQAAAAVWFNRTNAVNLPTGSTLTLSDTSTVSGNEPYNNVITAANAAFNAQYIADLNAAVGTDPALVAARDAAIGTTGATASSVYAAVKKVADEGINDGLTETPRSGFNPYPISHLLQSSVVMNEYYVNPEFEGATDWVITFPMKKHGIFNSSSDVSINVNIWDREESEQVGVEFSPVLTAGMSLTREVNVLSFVPEADSVLGSPALQALDVDNEYLEGWAQIRFGNAGRSLATNMTLTPANSVVLNAKGITETSNVASVQSLITANTAILATGQDVTAKRAGSGLPGFSRGVPVVGFASIKGRFSGQSNFFGETNPHRYR